MNRSIYVTTIIVFVAIVLGCNQLVRLSVPDKPLITRLAPAIILSHDSTPIFLADYLGNETVDSVQVPPDLILRYTGDSTCLLLAPLTGDSTGLLLAPRSGEPPLLSTLGCWANGFRYDLVLLRSPEKAVPISFDPGKKRYQKVEVAGQFNDWTPSRTPMEMADGIWRSEIRLFPGNYQYRLVVDGRMMLDPSNPDSAPNGIGGYNSVLQAGPLDAVRPASICVAETNGHTLLVNGITPGMDYIVLWQNHRLPGEFLASGPDGLTIRIPVNARKLKRSFLRVWAAEHTATTNDLLIPLDHGRVINDPRHLTRTDRETMILYFMMVDRFRNGNAGNDKPVDDPELDPRVNYMGGDLQGIVEKLREGYFTSLGVNTLWISPITQNPWSAYREYLPPRRKFSGYHGYWPVTLTSVDPRFGSPEVLRELITEAHQQKINVILDFVAHHVHEEWPLLAEHPEWITPLDLPDGRKNIRIWDEQRLTTWFDDFLPTLDLSKPEVCELVSDSAAWWVTEFELDGFRHDAAKHVPEVFWRTLTRKLDSVLNSQDRSFYQIGETFGSRELIKSYINPGMMDAQFDFNLYWEARNAFAFDNSSFTDLNAALHQSLLFFGYHHLMGNITGNQDLARFISYADGSLSAGEGDREVGWNRHIGVRDPVGYKRLVSLLAFNMTIPGIPVIYYGDEFGLPGANDPDNRRMMKFEGLSAEESATLEMTKALTRLRGDHMALLYGDFRPLLVTRDQYLYLRSYLDDVVIVAFNKSKEDVTVAIDLPEWLNSFVFHTMSGATTKQENNRFQIQLQPNSCEILSTTQTQ